MKIVNKIHNCKKYKDWRKSVLDKNNKTCSKCGIIGNCMQIHHKISLKDIILNNKIVSIDGAKKCGELWDIKNGICLCPCCHIDLHIKLRNNRDNIENGKV